MSLLNKGSTLAALDSPESMDKAVAIWDDLIERFGEEGEPDIQVQVVRALTKKAGAHMKMEQRDAAVAASPKTSVIRRRPLLKSTGKAYLDCS